LESQKKTGVSSKKAEILKEQSGMINQWVMNWY
jgi:hypothetical protein